MRLILIRHADAYAGFDGVVSGPRGCLGLTEVGRRQAEALRDHLSETQRFQVDLLLASVLPRAVQTAEIVAPALGFQTFLQDCDLCEIHTGEADGLAWAEYATCFGTFDMEAEPDRVFAPGGDSWRSFHDRVLGLCNRLAMDSADQTVMAVCHAGVIMAAMRVLLDVPQTGLKTRIQPTNTGISEWHYEPERDRWTLHAFNERGHLLHLIAES